MAEAGREMSRAGARLRRPDLGPDEIERLVTEMYVGRELLERARRP
jgi:hypothetical protein